MESLTKIKTELSLVLTRDLESLARTLDIIPAVFLRLALSDLDMSGSQYPAGMRSKAEK